MPGTTLGAGVRKEKGRRRAEGRWFPTPGPYLLYDWRDICIHCDGWNVGYFRGISILLQVWGHEIRNQLPNRSVTPGNTADPLWASVYIHVK